jgi:mannose/fructose/N-acetylgalactosamine-specific phosphotransferase system component IIB
MPLSLVRIDNRLIHGQVVEAWLPFVKAARVVVADDEAAGSPLIKAAMGLAVQSSVEVEILPLSQVDFQKLGNGSEKVLLLFRDVAGVMAARERGLPAGSVNLGNVHYGAGRQQVSPSVFLSQQELDQLRMLSESGMEVEARAVPTDRAIHLEELQERFGKGA